MMARRHVELSRSCAPPPDRRSRRALDRRGPTRREDLDARKRQPGQRGARRVRRIADARSTAATGRARSPARLKAIDVKPESIDGCLITHEHTDHVSGAGRGGQALGLEPLRHARHRRRRRARGKAPCSSSSRDDARLPVHDGDVDAHSARRDEPVGFVIESRSTGARAGLFYDIGYVTRGIAQACESLDILVIESNHDEDMLRERPVSAVSSTANRVALRPSEQSAKRAASRARW